MKYFVNCKCLEDVKKQYKTLCMELHPDVSGKDTTAEFQAMQNEYEKAFNEFKDTHKNAQGETYSKETSETAKEYSDLIEKLMRMDGVTIEIIGSFIWLSGNTMANKDAIKELGFKWSANKKMWYKSPEGYRKRSKNNYNIHDIRAMFDSETIQSEGMKKVTA